MARNYSENNGYFNNGYQRNDKRSGDWSYQRNVREKIDNYSFDNGFQSSADNNFNQNQIARGSGFSVAVPATATNLDLTEETIPLIMAMVEPSTVHEILVLVHTKFQSLHW